MVIDCRAMVIDCRAMVIDCRGHALRVLTAGAMLYGYVLGLYWVCTGSVLGPGSVLGLYWVCTGTMPGTLHGHPGYTPPYTAEHRARPGTSSGSMRAVAEWAMGLRIEPFTQQL